MFFLAIVDCDFSFFLTVNAVMSDHNTVSTTWVPCTPAKAEAIVADYPWSDKIYSAKDATEMRHLREAHEEALAVLTACEPWRDQADFEKSVHVTMMVGAASFASSIYLACKGRLIQAGLMAGLFAPMMPVALYGWWITGDVIQYNGVDRVYPADVNPALWWWVPRFMSSTYRQPTMHRATNTATPLFLGIGGNWHPYWGKQK